MKQIDLEPHEHSSSYEMKPESRWLFIYSVAFALVMAAIAGFFAPATWAMFVSGAMVAGSAVACFPKFLLTKIRR
ncbi:hypothetical protein OF122_12930 [Pelagibacterium flavum]|uniref:Uncharacterized protein n=1 Tax=Pelagibacterium flavum TaxID=2984530 RepID=A0ABY6INB0_9HYPH|nr:hypothetical protein [Pelagibacterium sp. YIM 151497]UYQ70962.1 hypothetical protein OF122_12930 [Pelagibacterium sp. YIM 151497]